MDMKTAFQALIPTLNQFISKGEQQDKDNYIKTKPYKPLSNFFLFYQLYLQSYKILKWITAKVIIII